MRGLDELAPLQAHGLAAHDARHVEPGDGADRDIDQHDVPAEDDGQHDDEKDEGHRVEDVDEAHEEPIHAPADEAGDGAPHDADHEADQRRHDADGQRYAPAIHDAHEQV